MSLSVEIPDRIAQLLQLDAANGRRILLEMLAAEGYRSGKLTPADVGELLDQKAANTKQFLKAHSRRARLAALEEYESVSDALDDFTAALRHRISSEKRRTHPPSA